ncbi:hypothetical protein Tco_1062845, partial [Tanacetum coccineum]
VMSTLAQFDSEIFSQTDGAQSSRVPIPLSDDPIRAVRQSHLVDTNIESGPLEDLRETKIPQPLPSTPSLVLPSDDLYLIGTSELVEDIKDESSDLDTKREGLEDEGPGLEDEDPRLEDEDPRLEDEGHGSKDEGPGSEEEVAPEGQQQEVLVVDIAADKPLGLGYGVLRRYELALGEGSVPSTFEIGQISRSMSKHQRVEETPTPRPRVRTTWVDPVDDKVYTEFLVDVPPARVPTLFEGYDRDLRELYTRLRDVRDEIFSQRYRLRSLKQEQERATVTFSAIWRQVLALKSWTGYVDAQRAEM